MRRAHRKSRFGCRVCKQRHIKCDESKPSCLNCLAVERRCSFLDGAVPGTASVHSPRPSVPPSPAPNRDPAPADAFGEGYTITHLELFHHFEHSLSHDLNPFKPGTDAMLRRAITESFAFPFLMDELIALSAAQKSTLTPDAARNEIYLAEATRLQTRGLSRFNSVQTELSDENCVAVFMYSALLGLHVLFDTFSLRSDFDAVMAKFVQCLSLHSGIRVIAANSWEKIHGELMGGDQSHLVPLEPVKADEECAPVWALLEQCGLGEEERGHCEKATKALQFIFSRRVKGSFRGALAVQEWAVRVPSGYIELLNQRRPEAMVILAYYAVLLHRDRDCWAIGDTGAYLIRSVTRHLGEQWAQWLEWPNKVLEEGSIESAAGDGLAP